MSMGILAAILVQNFITKKNQVMGAIFGLLITIGIGIWGFTLYDNGDAIALFGLLELGEVVFYLLVGAWAIYDIVMIYQAINGTVTLRLAKDTIIYQEMDVNSDVITVKTKGHVIEVSPNVKKADGVEWMRASVSGSKYGFILAETPILRKFNTFQQKTKIYAQTDTSSEVLETLGKGHQLELGESLEVDGVEWIKVSTRKTENGYVLGNTKGQVLT